MGRGAGVLWPVLFERSVATFGWQATMRHIAIESGAFPEWELGLQIFTEAQADGFSFDVLDSYNEWESATMNLRPYP